jgi:CubicO group peptidase (beta-lactamase class C family)
MIARSWARVATAILCADLAFATALPPLPAFGEVRRFEITTRKAGSASRAFGPSGRSSNRWNLRTGRTADSQAVDRRPVWKPEPARFADPNRAAKLGSAFGEIDRMMEAFATTAHVPGAAWGIVVDGSLAHAGSTGYRDLAAKAVVQPDTVFRIASMTKSFTALAIMKLRDEGKLSLDDPVERYIPELKGLAYPSDDSPRITIRHLLSHAEGFPEDNPWGDQQLGVSEDRFTEMLRRGIPFSNTPGVAYEYSNYGFAILGRVVSRVSGTPYRAFVEQNILRPLGMSSTTLEPSSVPPSRLARGYRWEDSTWKDEPLLPDGAFGSMGGMLTSIPDLARYVGAFLSAWPPRDGADTGPIRRSSMREMQQVWRPRPATVARDSAGALQLNAGGYGFALAISQTCAFGHVVSHGGGLPGFGSLMRWLPEYGVGIVAFGNATYTGWNRVFNDAFGALAKTGALEPRVVQPSAALVTARDAVSRLIVRWDDRLAESIAAQNLFLDRTADRRRADFDALHASVGACTPSGEFERIENALRGQWIVTCERGRLRASITLAPTVPPSVQYLDVTVVPPNEPARGGACVQ